MMNPLPQSQPVRIVLMGFMGSGKTTVGKTLAARLGWNFIDLDAAIEEHYGRTVPQIFAESGEAHFRREEATTLQREIAQTQVVIALGGGAMETAANQFLLRESPHTALVYLQAPFAQLQARCATQSAEPGATQRPLLADVVAAEARFSARLPIYEAHATLRLDTAERSPVEVVEAILQQLF